MCDRSDRRQGPSRLAKDLRLSPTAAQQHHTHHNGPLFHLPLDIKEYCCVFLSSCLASIAPHGLCCSTEVGHVREREMREGWDENKKGRERKGN